MIRMMPPWLLALVVLVAVCVIGWYLIYSHHDGVPSEGFSTASRAALRACETAFNACLEDGGDTASCTSAYNTCVASVSNSSVSTVDNAPSTGKSASSAVTARGTPTTPVADVDYKSLENQALTGKKATLSPELIKFIKDVEGKTPGADDDYNALINQALTGKIDDSLSPETKAFLKQIQGKMNLEYTKPTIDRLNAAQGIDASGDSVIVPGSMLNDPAVYKAFQQIIKPHETPLAQQPGLVANQRGADRVQAGAILTPSMRQQIRDDVRKAVSEELASIQNEYEITYEQQ